MGNQPSSGLLACACGYQPEGEPVYLHVYSLPTDTHVVLTWMDKIGMGAYHSGVEVYGLEYCFVGGFDDECGIQVSAPKVVPPGVDWVYKESILIGYTKYLKSEVEDIKCAMEKSWPRDSYHLLTKNCNHFSNEFALALTGTGIPTWINRLAGIGTTFAGFRAGGVPPQEELMDLIQGSTSPLDVKIEPTNLLPWIHPKASFTLPTDDTSLISFLAHDPGLTLRSFGDVPEIYIFVCFTRPCRVCQLVISGTSKFVRDSPKTVRIFADPPNFPDFYAMNQSPSHITCSLKQWYQRRVLFFFFFFFFFFAFSFFIPVSVSLLIG
eukprot:TRINITY_DN8647_c0_g2_i11.p1 TRINITY_DN8647_c0_g2~~TRINITY_DN8647_c0_g2_i11.p1  ORF type:complete len:323 (+),score=59.25 TRINITY_DN8647_c0_g2_i11:81-1049(+)